MFVFTLIPFLPLLAFLIIGLGGRWLGDRSHRVAIPAVVGSCALSVIAAIVVLRTGPIDLPLYTLIRADPLVVDLGLYIDQLAAVMLLLVTGVSSLVHIYSVRYMQGDPRYARFFAVIALFTFAMLMLVMSTNLLMLYMFWEQMGLCSYLLISHWSERRAACHAATKAFLVNAVADVGLGFGVVVTFATFRTLDIRQVLAALPAHVDESVNLLGWAGGTWEVPVLTLIALLLFVGAMGKSAQFPLHVWLPFAMEAPTPVSALIHAATMVNAGVFLVARLSPLYWLSPAAMTVMAVVGAFTALFAATVALTQTDIKRILAYSTISQLGFMMMVCGVGAFTAAIFHLVTHGAFKAFFFLSTGNVLQTVAAEFETDSLARRSGSLSGLAWSLSVLGLVLAWIPPLVLFSGPYERLWSGLPSQAALAVFWILTMATAFLTAFYFSRWVMAVFLQPLPVDWQRGTAHTEQIPNMAAPGILFGLVGGAVLLGGTLALAWTGFARFLSPVLVEPILSLERLEPGGLVAPSFLLPLAFAAGGWGAALYLQARPVAMPPWLADKVTALYVLFLNKGYVDEIYEAAIVQPTLRLARWLWQRVDVRVIDGLFLGLGTLSVSLARWLWRVVDVRVIDQAATGIGSGSVHVARWLWQTVDVRVVDRAATGVGRGSVTMAQWLWEVVDIRGFERLFGGVGRQSDATGEALRKVEPRMLQDHLLVMIFWMVLAMGLLFWLML